MHQGSAAGTLLGGLVYDANGNVLAGGLNPYVYVDNNPGTYADASGECIPCALAAGGGLLGLGVQAVSDYRSGKPSSQGAYVGAFTTGAIAGVGLMINPAFSAAVAIGAGGGFSGNVVKQTIDIASGAQRGGFNLMELGIVTAAGGVASGLHTPLAGVLEPSYGPIAQGLLTQYLTGSISSLTPMVAANPNPKINQTARAWATFV